ncbi:MAG: TIGR02147 family protein [Bdellovibrionota bacterium]
MNLGTQTALQTRDFRLFLQQELMRRCERNSGYSLRAFAKVLGIHHASLSRVLARKRPLTAKLTKSLCQALRLSPAETQNFLQQLPRKKNLPSEAVQYQELTLDTFVSISEWYHDAILELTHLQSFQPEPKWIAKVLGITQNEVKIAAERLQRLEFLDITDSGKWLDLSRDNTTNITNDFTSAALRKLQKKVLELSGEALENLPRTQRDHTSLMVAVDFSDLPEVKERIKKFRHELATFLQRKEAKPDSVCQLAISFFPLTSVPQEKP